MDQGVFRYRRRPKPNLKQQAEREKERRDYEQKTFNDLWRTLPKAAAKDPRDRAAAAE